MAPSVNGFYDQYDMSKRGGYNDPSNGFSPFFGNLGSLGSNGVPWTPLSGSRLDGDGFVGLNGSAWTPVNVMQSEPIGQVLTWPLLLTLGAGSFQLFVDIRFNLVRA